eukprot:TRINITY_DN29923_c0_g1_i1.p2 TRINITY_DN29923_c0_g1~~TRINITY_DN29923_c0_g1_i1.p2  ORF type:complete len:151 (-),score=25.24 TRINITY_DN29923_c0_g1_i1:79-531(-)
MCIRDRVYDDTRMYAPPAGIPTGDSSGQLRMLSSNVPTRHNGAPTDARLWRCCYGDWATKELVWSQSDGTGPQGPHWVVRTGEGRTQAVVVWAVDGICGAPQHRLWRYRLGAGDDWELFWEGAANTSPFNADPGQLVLCLLYTSPSPRDS